jgi:hypothetical protein
MDQDQDPRARPQSEPPAVRARVPASVTQGVFATGAVVMAGPSEFLIDFLQALGHPQQVVARIIVPHPVMPKLIDAIGRNLELYRRRFGELPRSPKAVGKPLASETLAPDTPAPDTPSAGGERRAPSGGTAGGEASEGADSARSADMVSGPGNRARGSAEPGIQGAPKPTDPPLHDPPLHDPHSIELPAALWAGGRGGDGPPTPEDLYSDLRLGDELMCGRYANALMVMHSGNEFRFDFVAAFFPQSVVSGRVFLAAGHAVAFLESLQVTWRQFLERSGQPPWRQEGESDE